MLLPVRVSSHCRVWADVSFRFEKHIYAESTEDVAGYPSSMAAVPA
jgi:hypothetical protein